MRTISVRQRRGRARHMLGALTGLLTVGVSLACGRSSGVTVREPTHLRVVRGTGHFDPRTGAVTWALGGDALLDASHALPGAYPQNCEPAGWNPATLVLSVNARIVNGSTDAVYRAPVELRLTGIEEVGVVTGVNTDLTGAGCGTNGLTLAGDDEDGNGVFDCISPDDPSNTADDPGWDFSDALGDDDLLGSGESSACRFVHFNVARETPFTFYYDVLGVVEDGWPPAPAIDPVSTPTVAPTAVVSGRCVTTIQPPDALSPAPDQMPSLNEVTLLGGSSPVVTPCRDWTDCRSVAGVAYCGAFDAEVPLLPNASTRLEVYQELDGVQRSPSSYVTVRNDTIAPTVVSTLPADGSVGVSVAGNVVVTFSEVVDPASVNAADAGSATIYLRRAGDTARLAATVALDAGGSQAVLDPQADLRSDSTYELVVTSGVRDLVGNALEVEKVVAFTTAHLGDNVAPTVVATQPANGATGLDRSTPVTVVFSEPIAAGAADDPLSPTCVDTAQTSCAAIVLQDLARGRRVPAARTLSADGTTVTLRVNDADYDSSGPDPAAGGGCVTGLPPTPELDLDCDSSYRLSVSTDIVDLAGNRLGGVYSGNFSTGVESDTVAPFVQSFFPPPGAASVAQGVTPEVLFSEPIAPATVSASSVSLEKDGVTAVPGTLSLSSNGLLVRFVPSSPLELSTRYVLFVNNGITDLAGNRLAAPQNTDFTIEAASDTTPPAVVSVSPPDGAANIGVEPVIEVAFSEAMAPASISSATVILQRLKSDDVTPELVVTGQVTLSGDRLRATFSPSTSLEGGRLHVLTVTTGVVDAAGNPMTADFVSAFRTLIKKRDDVPPCVTALGPADGSTGVAANTRLALGFSEPLAPESVTAAAFRLEDGAGTQLSLSASLSADGTSVLVVPEADLPAGPVTLQVLAGLRDNSGESNSLDQLAPVPGCLPADGQSQPTFGFTVVAEHDTVAPTVVSITPANGSTGVDMAADVVVAFSEPMNPLSLNDENVALIVDASGNHATMTRRLSTDASVLTLDPAALLAELTTYRVSVAGGGPRDLAGNLLAAGSESIFTTLDGSVDTTLPQVVSVCPPDGATNVDLGLVVPCNTDHPGTVVVTFSEPLDADTVSTGTFRLLQDGSVDRTQAVSLEGGGATVVITPIFWNGNGLKNATTHQVRISPAVTDTAGNPLVTTDLCGAGTGESCTDFGT